MNQPTQGRPLEAAQKQLEIEARQWQANKASRKPWKPNKLRRSIIEASRLFQSGGLG